MPSGKVHYEIWKSYRLPAVITSAALTVPSYYTTGSAETALIISASSVVGYFIGAVVTPDSDLIGLDRGESIAIRSVVFIPYLAWSTLYARIMQGLGGHRSFWSHAPLISSFIRLCWFTFPLVVLAYFMGWLDHNYIPYFIGVLFGLSMADTIHAAADFSSTLRRKFIQHTRSRRVHSPGD